MHRHTQTHPPINRHKQTHQLKFLDLFCHVINFLLQEMLNFTYVKSDNRPKYKHNKYAVLGILIFKNNTLQLQITLQ